MGLFRRAKIRDEHEDEITTVDVVVRSTTLSEELRKAIAEVKSVAAGPQA